MSTATLPGGFTYFEFSITPNTGPESGGTDVTIIGSGFDSTTQILIGNVALTNIEVVDSETITGTTAASTYGIYDVVAITGTTVLQAIGAFTYAVDDAFALVSISPNYGSAVGGNTVTFTGTCFDSTTTFTIGSEAVTDVVIIDANTATGTVPAGVAGWVDVTATQNAVDSTLTEAYQYISIKITGISPAFDYVGGGSAIQITGIGFEPNATVTIGGNGLVSPIIVNDTVITGIIPAGTIGTADVIAIKGLDSYTVDEGFEYLTAFTATGIDPVDGFVVGGDDVTITGTGFSDYATASIGGKPCTNVVVVNNTTITAVTPPGVAGTADVVISQFGGTATIGNGFTYVINPADRKGNKTIKDTYNGLLFLPDGLQAEPATLMDAYGNASPLVISNKGISVSGDFCASGACLGYASLPPGNAEILQTSTNPEDALYYYRNIYLAMMVGPLTPFHFGAVGYGKDYVEQDTQAFLAAAKYVSGSNRKLHIPCSGVFSCFVLNKTIRFVSATVTSDPKVPMVWIATGPTGAAIQIGNESPASFVDTPPQGHYEFPQIIFNPNGTPTPSTDDLFENITYVPGTDRALTGNLKVQNNIGIYMVNSYGVYLNWNYVKGFATSFKMGVTNAPGGTYGSANVTLNNIVEFVGTDIMNVGIHLDSNVNIIDNLLTGAVGETLIRGSTVGVVMQDVVRITTNNDTHLYPEMDVRATIVDLAVTWLWTPANSTFNYFDLQNRILNAPSILKKTNAVRVAGRFTQDVLK